MKRRNFLKNILLFLFAFIFGYTVKKEGENMILQRVAPTITDVLEDQSSENANSNRFINALFPPAPFVKAKGDGTSNDVTLLQALLNTGKNVYLPQATYIINDGLYLVGDQFLFGDGMGKTIIKATRSSTIDSFNMITNYNFKVNVTTNQNVKLEGITLDAQCQKLTDITGSSTNYAAAGVALRSVEGSFIEKVEVLNTGLHGVVIYDTAEVTIRDCRVRNTGYVPFPNTTDSNWSVKAGANGISITGSTALEAKKILIDNSYVENARDVGINSWAVGNVNITNCAVYGYLNVSTVNGRAGITLESLVSSQKNSLVANNRVYNNYSGIQLQSNHSIAKNNIIVGNSTIGVAVDGSYCQVKDNDIQMPNIGVGIAIRGKPTDRKKNTMIKGNHIIGAVKSITCTSDMYSVINGNTVEGSVNGSGGSIECVLAKGDTKYPTKTKIFNNNILKSKSAGIHLKSYDDVEIKNNSIFGATKAGIKVDGSDKIKIYRNDFDQYDSSTQLLYTIYFENNPSNCEIKYNRLKGFTANESSSFSPLGLHLPTTGIGALIVHDELDRNISAELNGVLKARVGSIIQHLASESNNVQVFVNTDGNKEWTRKNYSPTA